jgi:hypothetical protein
MRNQSLRLALEVAVRAVAVGQRVKRPHDAQRLYRALVERCKEGDEDLVILKIARRKLAS